MIQLGPAIKCPLICLSTARGFIPAHLLCYGSAGCSRAHPFNHKMSLSTATAASRWSKRGTSLCPPHRHKCSVLLSFHENKGPNVGPQVCLVCTPIRPSHSTMFWVLESRNRKTNKKEKSILLWKSSKTLKKKKNENLVWP